MIYLILIVTLILLIYFGLKIYVFILQRRVNKLKIKLAKTLKKIEEQKLEKKRDLKIGSVLNVAGHYIVVGIFYDYDIKFCVICPYVFYFILQFPIIFELDENNTLIDEVKNITDEVKKKARNMLQIYKEKNKDKFWSADV